jgi:hypothetical protein
MKKYIYIYIYKINKKKKHILYTFPILLHYMLLNHFFKAKNAKLK